MDNKPVYTKLGDLVGYDFTVLEAGGYTWKKWNNEAKRFEISEQYEKDFRKTYKIVTDKGILDLGSGQLSTLLEATYYKGQADINGKRFSVKSNGKTGTDVRYFFNLMREAKPKTQDVVLEDIDLDDCEQISISDVPF